MWQNDSEPQHPSTSASARVSNNVKHSSTNNLVRSKSSASLFKRAISLQFLSKNAESAVDREKAAHIKMRYKDTAKYVIWPTCRLPADIYQIISCGQAAPTIAKSEHDPRTVLMQPDIEDHRSPYMPCTINHVLRSDSEDSSEAEQVLEMTRL
ncbi:unnamed protein product [Caenorhabditis angaria]|uniref:Uncharacterized protein n=1 Tax=Caenorhabditis angaria TaxID=860376 RepID=A0A9P1IZD4_9PELO|nr:unnamed protein product [Caenorhabditis angaria]